MNHAFFKQFEATFLETDKKLKAANLLAKSPIFRTFLDRGGIFWGKFLHL